MINYLLIFLILSLIVLGFLFMIRKLKNLKTGIKNLDGAVKKLNAGLCLLLEIVGSKEENTEEEIKCLEGISVCENCINKIVFIGPSGKNNIIFKCKLTGQKVDLKDTCVRFKFDHQAY